MEKALQVLLVVILSGTKFLTAPITALNIGFNFLQTLIITTIGGILGVLFFFYLSEGILYVVERIKSLLRGGRPAPPKKVFSRKSRLIVHVIREYGLMGLAVVTPTILSIPVGTFLATRYFHHDRKRIFKYLFASVVFWSVVISSGVLVTSVMID